MLSPFPPLLLASLFCLFPQLSTFFLSIYLHNFVHLTPKTKLRRKEMYYFRSQVHVDPFSSMEPNTSPPPPPQSPIFTDPTPTATAAATAEHHQWSLSLAIIGKSLTTVLKRFHAGYFRITLSLGSQALLWRSLIEPSSTHNVINNPLIYHIFRRLHPVTYTFLWLLAFIISSLLSFLYLLRLSLHLKLVKAEFQHHVGVNYLFAPWISWLLLLQCAPIGGGQPGTAAYLGLCWALVVPIVALDIKIYGQWFTTKGQRCNLTAVANPTSQMTVIGNLVGSRAAALMGWHETAIVLFSLGMVHYLVLFVTLYQRLSGTNTLPAMLRPVFSLFFAAPAVASLAWAAISGRFDTPAKMLFFLSLFLFTSLACRPNLFKRAMERYNVTWWAYPFPITVVAIAATEYAEEVRANEADVLMLGLSSLSMAVTFLVLLFTVCNKRLIILSPRHQHLPTHHNSHSKGWYG